MNNTLTRRRTGFTLIELIAVIVVLAVLAGVALPKYFNYSSQAKAASCKGTLGGVRAGIANFYANEAINGTPAYPTLVELQTIGTVMQEDVPENPYDSDNTINAATSAQAAARTVTGDGGWAYYVDNTASPPTYTFYANTATTGVNENAF
ncbi:MAG: type II secretion system protein [Planctomycetota bacterium]|jgi:prepilin-type N-terminal cleavage/methylation domain-containing protein